MIQHGQTLSAVRKEMVRLLSGLYPPDEATAITRLVLDHLGFPPKDLILKGDLPADRQTLMQINKIVTELKGYRPVQYVLGVAGFHDLLFAVDESVLIPRQETEELVDMIIKENSDSSKIFCDLGTGSGCIAVSLAHALPGAEVHATDISQEALATARKNAERNGVKITFHHADLLSDSPFPKELRFDILVSNPPYVTEAEKSLMDPHVKDHEPSRALFVPDRDPLVFYRRIAGLAPACLNTGGCVWLEINERFGRETADIFARQGFGEVSVLKDLRQKDRFIKATL
ncbi:MAG: peptide chain release factor N(5)-glutamine methyltransferase [Bacteroidota bacterium]